MLALLILALAHAQESMLSAYSILTDQFSTTITRQEFERAAIEGMLATIESDMGGEGSELQSIVEYEEEQQWRRGQREGYGLRVQLIPRQGFFVDGVIKDSPSDKAGIKPSDAIVSFNGQALTGLPPRAMLNLLNQDLPGEIPLEILRDGQIFPISMKKGKFSMDMISEEDAISLHFFGEGICQELKEISAERATQPLVLDLRDNEGGLWDESIECIDLFLDENLLIGHRKMTDQTRIPILSKTKPIHQGQLIILVNQGTRGPAELFSLVLQEHKRATLVGERTFGDAIDFQFYPLNEQWMLKIAETEMLSADCYSWNKTGVTPDVSVSMYLDRPSYTPVPQTDIQLETALRLMATD